MCDLYGHQYPDMARQILLLVLILDKDKFTD